MDQHKVPSELRKKFCLIHSTHWKDISIAAGFKSPGFVKYINLTIVSYYLHIFHFIASG
jgi:hypothetical protein